MPSISFSESFPQGSYFICGAVKLPNDNISTTKSNGNRKIKTVMGLRTALRGKSQTLQRKQTRFLVAKANMASQVKTEQESIT